jgi:hypothetical protein
MSIEELKKEASALSPERQRELIAYLLHLRESQDPNYPAMLAQRLDDADRRHWLTPDEFEARLNEP